MDLPSLRPLWLSGVTAVAQACAGSASAAPPNTARQPDGRPPPDTGEYIVDNTTERLFRRTLCQAALL